MLLEIVHPISGYVLGLLNCKTMLGGCRVARAGPGLTINRDGDTIVI